MSLFVQASAVCFELTSGRARVRCVPKDIETRLVLLAAFAKRLPRGPRRVKRGANSKGK